MDLNQRLSISYYKTIATINEPHKIYLVQHQESGKIFVKKILDVYSLDVYNYLKANPIKGIPNIIDFAEDGDSLILIEEYISGMTFREKMESGTLTLTQIITYAAALCDILEKLHSHQSPIIHRDIKPTNIMITSLDNVVLLDFNAAKYHSDIENREADTVLLGTQGYAAPEQYGFGESSPQTDIYSLGVIINEALQVVGVKNLQLKHIISKCIQIDPSKRYKSVQVLKNDLLKLMETQQEIAKRPSRYFPSLPPGFRSLNLVNMLIAVPSYFLIFYVCLSMEVTGAVNVVDLWLNRFTALFIVLLDVCIGFNYLGIQNNFLMCRSKNKTIHYIGVTIFISISTFVIFFVLMIIETTVFQQ